MRQKIKVFREFCRKPNITKIAITLSSLAVGVSLFSADPIWYDQRPMPESLKKRLY